MHNIFIAQVPRNCIINSQALGPCHCFNLSLGSVQSNKSSNEWKRNSGESSKSDWDLLFVGHLISVPENLNKISVSYEKKYEKNDPAVSSSRTLYHGRIGVTHVAKNSSGSESRVSACLSCSPSRRPIKGVVLVANVLAEIWLLGAKADDPDARKAIATISSVEKNRMEDMLVYLLVSRRKSDRSRALTVNDQRASRWPSFGNRGCVIRQCVT